MATSPQELEAVRLICEGLALMVNASGTQCAVLFDAERDTITVKVDGANFVINVAGDSPAGVVADIFRQLGPAIHKVVY